MWFYRKALSMQIDIVDIFLVTGTVQGLFFCMVLLATKNNKQANRPLALLMLLWAVIPFEIFMYRTGGYNLASPLIGIFWPVSVALLPSLWIYVNRLLSGIKKHEALHFVPVVIYYVLMVPFFLSESDDKLSLLYASEIPGYDIWQLQLMSFVVLLQNLIYLPLALFRTLRFQAKLRDNYSFLEKRNIHWLMTVVSVLFVAFLLSFAGVVKPAWMLNSQYLMAALITISLFYACFRSVVQAQVGDPERLVSDHSKDHIQQVEDPAFLTLAKPVADKLADVMDSDTPYLDYDISLAELASHVGVDRHLLSEVLNKYLHIKFYDYINKYRIDAATQQMTQGVFSKSLSQLANEVGFKSRTTFYAAFKKHTGKTPTAYLNENKVSI